MRAGALQTVTVRFSPTEEGDFSGTVRVSSNGGGGSVRVTGVGAGVSEPEVMVSPSAVNFGTVKAGGCRNRTVQVQNTGEGTLRVTATATAPFSIASDRTATLDGGELALVTVRFCPPTKGSFTGRVELRSNAGEVTVTVRGRGTRG